MVEKVSLFQAMTQQEIAKGILAIGPDITRRSFFAFSRANEYAADALGVKYLKSK